MMTPVLFTKEICVIATIVNASTDGYTFVQLTKDVRGKKCLIQKIKDIFANRK